jgi:iron(III) transport system substrate-binding protein
MSVMNRSMSEYRAGNPIYDIVLNNSDPLLNMHQEGMIGKYDSTVMQKYPKDQIDPRLGPISRFGIVGVLYNKSLVSPEDAPKALEDLVQPKYKGMLVMADPTLHVTTIQWLSSLHKVMSKDKADKYIRELAAMKPTLVESMLPGESAFSTGGNAYSGYFREVCLHRRKNRRAARLCADRENARRQPLRRHEQ